jgi:hypothetical protein
MALQWALPLSNGGSNAAKPGLEVYIEPDGPERGDFPLSGELVDASAIPNPFSTGLALATAFRRSDLSRRPSQHRHFETLVLAMVLGHVRLDVVDLRDPKVTPPRLGKAFSRADPDGSRRFLGMLRTGLSPETVVGGTDPEALFWPNPRRFEGGLGDAEWNRLVDRVSRDPKAGEARALLWSWRQWLIDVGVYDPTIPWARGLDWMLEGVLEEDPRTTVETAARGVGPVRLLCKAIAAGEPESLGLYFPVLDTTIAEDLLSAALRGIEPPEAGVVTVRDGAGRALRKIAMPSPKNNATSMELGGGVVGPRDAAVPVEPPTGDTLRLDPWFAAFAPLYAAPPAEQARWSRLPLLAPDPVRLVTLRLGALGSREGNSQVSISYSAEALKRLFRQDKSGRSRLPAPAELTQELDADIAGCVLSLPGDAGARHDAVFVERASGQDVGDLSFVGWLLWGVFVGEKAGGCMVEESGTIYFRESEIRFDSQRPIEPQKLTLTEILSNQQQVEGWSRRLATIQRFVAAYPPEGAAHARLFNLAARAWARRLAKREVKPMGDAPAGRDPVSLGGRFMPALARG